MRNVNIKNNKQKNEIKFDEKRNKKKKNRSNVNVTLIIFNYCKKINPHSFLVVV